MIVLGNKRNRVELACADPERILSGITDRGINVYDVVPTDELHIRLTVDSRYIPVLADHMNRVGGSIDVLDPTGSVGMLRSICKRPVLIVFILILLVLTLYLPTKILFVTVDGNASLTQQQILSAAEECGIRFGTSRRSVKSEKMKNALLSQLPQLQWAGINTQGCVAVISVKERLTPTQELQGADFRGITAVRDGVIREMTVTSGNPLCSVGQVVRQGQLLVSPYKDCGIILKTEPAKGEIYAETNRHLKVAVPTEYRSKGEILSSKKNLA